MLLLLLFLWQELFIFVSQWSQETNGSLSVFTASVWPTLTSQEGVYGAVSEDPALQSSIPHGPRQIQQELSEKFSLVQLDADVLRSYHCHCLCVWWWRMCQKTLDCCFFIWLILHLWRYTCWLFYVSVNEAWCIDLLLVKWLFCLSDCALATSDPVSAKRLGAFHLESI